MLSITRETNEASSQIKPTVAPELTDVERHSWRNWFLLVTILLLATVAFITALPPLLSERLVNPWPWVKTDLVLLVGLSLAVLIFVVYLTQQQRKLVAAQRHLQRMQEKTSERTRRHYDRLFALFNVGGIMGSETNPQIVFDRITDKCIDIFDCQQASLRILDSKTKELMLQSIRHSNSAKNPDEQQIAGEKIASWVAANRESLLLGPDIDLGMFPGFDLDAEPVSALAVPILVEQELVGVLSMSSDESEDDYDEEDLRALQLFAENAGTWIRYTEQADRVKQRFPSIYC
jgi:hypothetical protein